MLLLLQGRLHRAALPRPRGCAEVTALLGGWDWAPLPELPKIPIPELHEQNNPAEHAVLGTPLHPAAPRGAVCNPLHPHPPVPAATPGDKTQWEASPGVPESLLQDFSIVGNPSRRTYQLEKPRTYCVWPKLPGARSRAGCGMRCTAAALDQPPALSASLPRASLRCRKLDFLLPPDLHPSAPRDLHPATPVAPVRGRGRFSIAGSGGRSHPRGALAPLPPGSA